MMASWLLQKANIGQLRFTKSQELLKTPGTEAKCINDAPSLWSCGVSQPNQRPSIRLQHSPQNQAAISATVADGGLLSE